MGVRTTSKNAGPTGANSTPFMDGHLDKFFNTEFNKGDIGNDYIHFEGMDASGGTTDVYTDPTGQQWKSHTFNASGSFVVASVVPHSNSIEYLVVGGGGGGGASGPSGYHGAGGGGGGNIRSNVGGTMISVTGGPKTYTITVGAGGPAGTGNGPPATPGGPGAKGGDSSIAGPDITTITAGGGGGSMGSQSNPDNNWPSPIGGKDTGGSPMPGGGSGAGGSPYPIAATGQVTTGNTGHPGGIDQGSPALGWGKPGGDAPNSHAAGGGGGATQDGGDAPAAFIGGAGGNGAQYTLVGGPTAVGTYAGGGGGGGGNPGGSGGNGGTGGGGAGGWKPGPGRVGQDGTANTGGGGGGGAQTVGGAGGSGIVVVRYKQSV